MNFKIQIIEKELLLREKDQIIENWRNRYDHFFKKHKKLQELWLAEEKVNKNAMNVDFNKIPNNVPATENRAPGTHRASITAGRKSVILNEKPSINTPVNPNPKANLVVNLDGNIEQNLIKGNIIIDNASNVFLLKKKFVREIESVNGALSMKFINEIKKIQLEPKDELQLDVISKIISAVYSELVKVNHRRGNFNPLYIFVYDYLLNRYGNVRQKTEEKIVEILRTCSFYKSYPRIRMFLRLMTMLDDPYEYDGHELHFYIKAVIALDNVNKQFPGLGLTVINAPKVTVDLKIATDFIRNFLGKPENESISKQMDIEKFLNIIRENKERDPDVPARIVVDYDLVIENILDLRHQYYILVYKNMFTIVDVKKENCINFEQFWILVNNIETKKFTFREALNLFNKYYDIIDEKGADNNNKFLSFHYFSKICEKNSLFSKQKLKSFNFDNINHGFPSITELQDHWFLEKNLLKVKFLRSGTYNTFYEKCLHSIEDYFFNPDKKSDLIEEVIWTRYRILVEESNRNLLEFEVNRYMIASLVDLHKHTNFILF